MSNLSNRTVLEKADLALADLTAGDGVLQPDAAKKFMRLLIKQSVLMKLVTFVPMGAPKKRVTGIRFGSRVLRPGQEATALAPADRVKPDFTSVELDAVLFKGEVQLSDEVLEDSVEKGQLRQTIMELLTDAIARDIEEIVINGDTASADPYLALLDGVLKQSTSNVVDAAGAQLTKPVLRDILKTLPSPYKRDKKSMRIFTSEDADIDYRSTLAERATAAGDKFLETDAPVLFSGAPLQPIPLMPDDLGAGLDQTVALFCNPKNIHVGMWRKIRIETDRDISAGVLKIVATLRFDVKFSDEPGVVKAVNIGIAA